jgi:hypothetical protein
MRRSLLALAVLVAGLVALLIPVNASLAAPRAVTAKSSTSTISRAALAQMRNTNTAANVAQAKRLAMSKKNGYLFFVQARNPQWARSGLMTFPQAVASRHALQVRGLSAHIHNTTSGSFVHYGMVHWATRGATTDHRMASAGVATLRSLGLQARIVSRVYKN